MIAPAARWPGATQRPVSYAGQAGTIAPLGWVLHVVVGDGSPWATFETAVSPKRRFSHLWIAKDGHAEQYASLWRASWAQGAGNDTYWSIETEGLPTEPLTDAQVRTLAAFHAWSGTADAIASSPGDKGIGTHQMGGQAWGGHTCPDPAMGLPGPRSRQRQAILNAAAAIRNGGTDMAFTLDDIATAVWSAQFGQAGGGKESAGTRLARAASPPPVDVSASAAAIAAAVVAALPAGQGFTVDQLASAVADKFAARLTA